MARKQPDIDAPPPLDEILNYRSVWLLCSTNKFGDLLKGRYYASVQIGGSSPLWGVWTVGGRFLRFYSSRKEIEADYSRLVWRRKMARFELADIRDHSLHERRLAIAEAAHIPIPVNNGDKAIAALKARAATARVAASTTAKRSAK